MPRLTKAQIEALTPEQIDTLAKTDLTALKRIVSDLQAINKKSYQRMTAKGMNTGFVQSYERAGGYTSVKTMTGKNAASQVKSEFKAQMRRLQAKTRTMSGAKQIYEKMVSGIDPEHKILPAKMEYADKDQIARFWELYHAAKEHTAERVRGGHDGSPLDIELSNIISDNMRDGDLPFNEMEDKIKEDYEKVYKERQAGISRESNPFSIKTE